MNLYLTPMQVGDVTLIEAAGRITLGRSVASLRDQIHELAGTGHTKIVLNLAQVAYIDSSGLGELVSAYTTIANAGGAIKLLHLTSRVRDLLQITKLTTLFETFDDEAEALRSFS
ncbi:MAG TPA: STAS domain-containing protein [Bryobacteraceae bacterium]